MLSAAVWLYNFLFISHLPFFPISPHESDQKLKTSLKHFLVWHVNNNGFVIGWGCQNKKVKEKKEKSKVISVDENTIVRAVFSVVKKKQSVVDWNDFRSTTCELISLN